jgi:hypothetical protein
MIPDEVLGLAVEREIISAEQAAGLRALARERDPAIAEPQDEERLRFVSGFGDVFVTIGLALFLGSLGYFVGVATEPFVTSAVIALTSWLLAEFFTRRRRMALPSIVLLIIFAGACYYAVVVAFKVPPTAPQFGGNWFARSLGLNPDKPGQLAAATLLTAVLVLLHYLRFRVPITVAAGTAAVAGTLLAICYALAPDVTAAALNILLLVCGLAIFSVAMRFDMSDPQRVTRSTDIAFWLHLLAAPLIVHPLISGLLGGRSLPDTSAALAVLSVFLALGGVAVLVDRRAMLVSGLTYAGIAFGTLINRAGLTDKTVPATLLALGAFVLLLSAGWRPLRAAILNLLPGRLSQRLPNPALSS